MIAWMPLACLGFTFHLKGPCFFSSEVHLNVCFHQKCSSWAPTLSFLSNHRHIVCVFIDISIYFTNYKCIFLLVFKWMKPKMNVIWLNEIVVIYKKRKADLNLVVDHMTHRTFKSHWCDRKHQGVQFKWPFCATVPLGFWCKYTLDIFQKEVQSSRCYIQPGEAYCSFPFDKHPYFLPFYVFRS